MESSQSYWRKCSTCKKPLGYGVEHFVCSVSTCNGQRTGYVFCGMSCFESHLPGARHRDAGAVRKTAPAGPAPEGASTGETRRIIVRPATAGGTPAKNAVPREILIIASRLKDYIQARAEMSTSASVMDVLSDHVRILADRAIDQARAEGRKTVMDRDFEFLKDLC